MWYACQIYLPESNHEEAITKSTMWDILQDNWPEFLPKKPMSWKTKECGCSQGWSTWIKTRDTATYNI